MRAFPTRVACSVVCVFECCVKNGWTDLDVVWGHTRSCGPLARNLVLDAVQTLHMKGQFWVCPLWSMETMRRWCGPLPKYSGHLLKIRQYSKRFALYTVHVVRSNRNVVRCRLDCVIRRHRVTVVRVNLVEMFTYSLVWYWSLSDELITVYNKQDSV